MSILQFVWQLTILFGIGILLLVGLFSSPWYILAAALLIVLVMIQRLMPDPTLQADLLGDRSVPDPGESRSEAPDTSPEILYRGATYSPPADPSFPVVSGDNTPRQYRGAVYTPPDTPEQPTVPAPAVLRYRGVPYCPETMPEADPEATTTTTSRPEGS